MAKSGLKVSSTPSPAQAVDERPTTESKLYRWIVRNLRIKIPHRSVCPGHSSPWDIFQKLYFGRPPIALVLGPRGGGKSYLSALNIHLTSRWNPGHSTCVLGGSLSQSEQIYQALEELVELEAEKFGKEISEVSKFQRSKAVYANGSDVKILAASSRSVRGPHVPSLQLDEVDEIDPDCREAALGMCMGRRKRRGKRGREQTKGSVIMSSTWHRPYGPMADLIKRARAGELPLYSFCVWEVLERCSEERSGKNLENCPTCPLVTYCHDVELGKAPKAKRSNGHYTIDSLIQKIHGASKRTFESDYLCSGPKSEGVWFPSFHRSTHVTELAEYNASLPVYVSIDPGVYCGAVFFQVNSYMLNDQRIEEVTVFADYLKESSSAGFNGDAIADLAQVYCSNRISRFFMDAAGRARTASGATVYIAMSKDKMAHFGHPEWWPFGSVVDGLALLESFVDSADQRSKLQIHPRCVATIEAMENYRRAKRSGQWQGYPEDPQHPYEEQIDALRGGLRSLYPSGRVSPTVYTRVSARQVF